MPRPAASLPRTGLKRFCPAEGNRHEREKASIPTDGVGFALLACAIEVYKMSRSDADICAELQFKIDNIDETTPFGLMRP